MSLTSGACTRQSCMEGPKFETEQQEKLSTSFKGKESEGPI